MTAVPARQGNRIRLTADSGYNIIAADMSLNPIKYVNNESNINLPVIEKPSYISPFPVCHDSSRHGWQCARRVSEISSILSFRFRTVFALVRNKFRQIFIVTIRIYRRAGRICNRFKIRQFFDLDALVYGRAF